MGFLKNIWKPANKDEKTSAPTASDTEFREYERKSRDRLARHEQAEELYGDSVRQHYQNIENIKTLYMVARELEGYDGPQMQKCINLCWEDISLADDVRAYCAIDQPELGLPNYYTFVRLAIIYEKRGEYQKGIEVCQLSISRGFEADNDGKIYGRLARLIKKQQMAEEKELSSPKKEKSND